MKRNFTGFTCIAFLIMGALSGCEAKNVTALVNTIAFDVTDFQSLQIDYDTDPIYIFENNINTMILKEYMNENKKNYYARITADRNGQLRITEGKRPRYSNFESYIEIFIPKNYTESLSLHSTSGTIKSEVPMNLLGDFSIDTTSGVIEISNAIASNIKVTSANGSLRFENIIAETIEIQTTNAITSINQANCVINYKTNGGNLIANALSGSGSLNASGDGFIDALFTNVTDDIYAYSKNGNLTLQLPKELAFKFSATTKEGAINTTFSDQLAVFDNTTIGTVGSNSKIFIELETRNGDIKVIK